MLTDQMMNAMPGGVRNKVQDVFDVMAIAARVNNRKILFEMLPSVNRGFILKQGKQGEPVGMKSSHKTHFDFRYQGDFPEMYELYRRAIQNQWDADTQLDWSIDVDPMSPDIKLLPDEIVPIEGVEAYGFKLSPEEKQRFVHSFAAWLLSQFLHGEQGALYAAAQVTECVPWLDGKLYGATQVMDEARHVEVFLRYVDTKLNKLYQVNDNLFTIMDELMTDSRWDMKFLGMQIMIEGLALGAFNTLYNTTQEPLLKEMLRYVIQDEARHVHYGVLALRQHFTETLDERERREREDWTFEVARLMRDRFFAHEIFEEWFEGPRMRRSQWNEVMFNSPFMTQFRQTMFKRLIPNLEYIGLLSPRIQKHYEEAGLMVFAGGRNASELSAQDLLDEAA